MKSEPRSAVAALLVLGCGGAKTVSQPEPDRLMRGPESDGGSYVKQYDYDEDVIEVTPGEAKATGSSEPPSPFAGDAGKPGIRAVLRHEMWRIRNCVLDAMARGPAPTTLTLSFLVDEEGKVHRPIAVDDQDVDLAGCVVDVLAALVFVPRPYVTKVQYPLSIKLTP